MKLTAAQQDYLEVIHRLELELGRGSVRVSDIAGNLGTKLPTVSRTVHRLAEAGLVEHTKRGRVGLSDAGRRMAIEVTHRHDDLLVFFGDILGLPREEAEANACQIEHGLSNMAAQRLHEFLNYLDEQEHHFRVAIRDFTQEVTDATPDFKHLRSDKANGWRV